jgi:hypothetical protein
MKKLLLLLVVLWAAAGVPAVRDGVEPFLEPLAGPLLDRLDPAVERVKGPILRWSAESKAKSIAMYTARFFPRKAPLPQPHEFTGWLQRHYSRANQDVAIDPWGSYFYLVPNETQLIIGSAGPDGRPRTADDIVVSVPRP